MGRQWQEQLSYCRIHLLIERSQVNDNRRAGTQANLQLPPSLDSRPLAVTQPASDTPIVLPPKKTMPLCPKMKSTAPWTEGDNRGAREIINLHWFLPGYSISDKLESPDWSTKCLGTRRIRRRIGRRDSHIG